MDDMRMTSDRATCTPSTRDDSASIWAWVSKERRAELQRRAAVAGKTVSALLQGYIDVAMHLEDAEQQRAKHERLAQLEDQLAARRDELTRLEQEKSDLLLGTTTAPLPFAEGKKKERMRLTPNVSEMVQRLLFDKGVTPEVPLAKRIYGSAGPQQIRALRAALNRMQARGLVSWEAPREAGESERVWRMTEDGREWTRACLAGEEQISDRLRN
jgi:hypothetical protein